MSVPDGQIAELGRNKERIDCTWTGERSITDLQRDGACLDQDLISFWRVESNILENKVLMGAELNDGWAIRFQRYSIDHVSGTTHLRVSILPRLSRGHDPIKFEGCSGLAGGSVCS